MLCDRWKKLFWSTNKKRFKNIRKIVTDQDDDYTTCCLLYYPYFKKYYKLIAIDLG